MADGAGWLSASEQPAPGEGASQQRDQPRDQPRSPEPSPGWSQPQPPPPPPPPPAAWVSPQQSEQPQRWGAPQPGGPSPNGIRQPGGPPPPIAPKPGVVALRPLGVGEILDGSFAAVRANPGAALGISAALTAVVVTVDTAVGIAADQSSTSVAYLLGTLSMLSYFGLIVFMSGVLSIVVSEATLGTKVSLTQTVRRVAPRVPGLVALTVSILVATALGLVVLVVGAVFVWVILALATPAYVLEGGTVRDALRRSTQLVEGAWWRTFGILLLAAIVFVFLGLVFALGSTIVLTTWPGAFGELGDLTVAGHVVAAVGDLIAFTVAVPVAAGTITMLYVDRRIRREGLDVTLAETARARAAQIQPG